MVATHRSIFVAMVVTLTNQCLAKPACNSDCMFFKSNKDSPVFPYFKSCTAAFGTLLKAYKKNKFIIMLKNVYCHGNDKRCGYLAEYPYAINGTCCDYMLIDIANHYNLLNKRRE